MSDNYCFIFNYQNGFIFFENYEEVLDKIIEIEKRSSNCKLELYLLSDNHIIKKFKIKDKKDKISVVDKIKKIIKEELKNYKYDHDFQIILRRLFTPSAML